MILVLQLHEISINDRNLCLISANVAATAATQSVERPILPTSDQRARSFSDTKATLKHQQNVLKLQQVFFDFQLKVIKNRKFI